MSPVGAGRRPVTRYRYVDFAARAQAGFRNHVVAVESVPDLVARYGAEECYASVFRFSADILLYLEEQRVAGRPSVAGYDGRVWTPFLPLDIDAHPPETTLDAALELARRTYALLVERWQVPAAAVHPYFRGSKGFHLLLDTRACCRVSPSGELHRILSHLRLEILTALPDAARPLFDLAIGDKVRLLRLPNTRHAGSGLFKIPLAADELLAADVESIRALARAPRPLTRVAAGGLVPLEPVAPAPALVERFERARRAVRRARTPHPYRQAAPPAAAEAALCAARRAIWQADVAPGGRNNAAIRLASAFRLAGYDRDETAALLREWAARQRRPLPAGELSAVVASAYARPYPYTYGCHDEVIRAACPFADRLGDCPDYRAGHPRAQRDPA